ncbi:hypothetical protein P7K49_002386, partial [Saguinus oedipus]
AELPGYRRAGLQDLGPSEAHAGATSSEPPSLHPENVLMEPLSAHLQEAWHHPKPQTAQVQPSAQ